MHSTCIVYVNSHWCDFKDIIFKTQNISVSPNSQSSVLGQTVTAYAGSGEYYIAVGGSYLYSFYYFNQVNAITFGIKAPFIQKGQYGGTVTVFYYFGCF